MWNGRRVALAAVGVVCLTGCRGLIDLGPENRDEDRASADEFDVPNGDRPASADGTAPACPTVATLTYEHIAPIVAVRCGGCHAGPEHEGDFIANEYEDTIGVKSPLEKWRFALTQIELGRMPPPEETRLTACEVDAIQSWVASGAPENLADVGTDNSSRVSCAEPTSGSETSTRRLSREELGRTLAELFGEDLAREVEGPLSTLPADRYERTYTREARGVTSVHVNAYFDLALAVASRVSASTERRTRYADCLSGGDIPDAELEACAESFIEALGPRVYRRPLSDLEREELVDLFVGDAPATVEERTETVVQALLLSPNFLYELELGAEPIGGGAFALSPYEVASRLSYLLVGSMPDAQLFEAAAQGELDDPSAIAAEAERLLEDPRAKGAVGRFFDEWLELDNLPGVPMNEGLLDGIDRDALTQGIALEAERFIAHQVFEAESGFSELFTSTTSFVEGDALAALYGVTAPPSGTEPVTLPADERAGLLTRAALLLSGDGMTHPILRGVFVQRQLLCRDISLPSPDEVPPERLEVPMPDPSTTTRRQWEELTSPPECASCHSQFNSFGFAAENYDPLGRFRDVELTVDASTSEMFRHDIDAQVVFQLDGETHEIDGLIALEKALAESDTAVRCFAEQLFRHAAARPPTRSDACVIQGLVDSLESGASLRDVLFDFVTSSAFLQVRPRE